MEPQIINTPFGVRKFYDVEQNTASWYELRSGIPTASSFDKILTPSELKPSKSAQKLMAKLRIEREVGHVVEFQSDAMREGHEREPESRNAFERATGLKVTNGGFWTSEDGRFGCSPDGLIGNDGLLELKNPKAETHDLYWSDNEKLLQEYRLQIQGQLYITGRKFIKLQSYYPEARSIILTIERDDEVMKAFDKYLLAFCDELDASWQKKLTWLNGNSLNPTTTP